MTTDFALIFGVLAVLAMLNLNRKLNLVLERLKHMSAATDALVSAVTDLSNALNDDTTAITTAITDLKNAQNSGDDAAVEAATANIENAVNSLKANTAALNQALPTAGTAQQPDPNAPTS